MAARKRISLNGTWNYVPDQYCRGETNGFMGEVNTDRSCSGKDPADHETTDVGSIPVPSSWNMVTPELRYYERQLWYYKHFKRPDLTGGKRAFLCFEGSYYRTRAWVNEKEAGQHLGGFTPFEFEITDQLESKNLLAVLVDAARKSDRIPTTVTDWFTYGGLTRDVFIEVRPRRFITDFFIHLDKAGRNITGRISASHTGRAVVSIARLGIKQTVEISGKNKTGTFTVPVPEKLELWSPENPRLYPVSVTFDKDQIRDRVGFRTVSVKDGDVILNGKPIFLKGVSVHEDHFKKGRSLDDRDRENVFDLAKELGLNFLRVAHYPHSRRMAQMADEKGILLWEEIPVYWDIEWENKMTYADAENQLRELILRDRNRASVILWSIANETPPTDKGRTAFLTKLCRFAKRMDRSRLVTAAIFKEEKGKEMYVVDPVAEELDVLGINQYFGWYGFCKPEEALNMLRFRNTKFSDKPVIISEFGAGAKAGCHGKLRFTEEYQAAVYENMLKALESCDSIKGMTPWILMDFRTPLRENTYQRGFNLKGLVDRDRKTRKKAFYVYKAFESKKCRE